MNKFDIDDLDQLFDYQNVDDLPESCKKDILYSSQTYDIIAHLFSLRPKLCVNEILVAMYRKFGLEKKRKRITDVLSSMKKRNILTTKIENFVTYYEICPNQIKKQCEDQKEEKEEEKKIVQKKLIPLSEWNRYHAIPKMCTMRYYVAHRQKNGFDEVLRLSNSGRKVLIDEEKFFKWAAENNKKFLKEA